MKKVFLTLIILAIGGVYFLIREPVLKSDEIDEINHSLLASLDPHLGYAHNIDLKSVPDPKRFHFHFSDPEYQFLGNGFIKMSFEEKKNPIVIGVMGSSETDPFLFDGNWPLLLHQKLKQRNVPHIVYNGAVSGYNSNQIFIKFTRDLLQLDKLNYLISYHGATDCPINEDTVENHRDVHPKTLLTLTQVTRFTNQADLNLWKRIKSLIQHEKYPIQLGVAQNDFVKNYLKNTNLINVISKDYNIKFLHVQILYPSNETQIMRDEDIIPPDADYTSKFVSCLKNLNGELSKLTYSYSFQGKIGAQDKYFYDPMHLTPKGNDFLADEIIKQLKLTP